MTTVANDNKYEYLKELISNTTEKPTIVNPQSNFVVVTYWWGRGNKNANTSRPCGAFFEVLVRTLVNTSTKGDFFKKFKAIIKKTQDTNKAYEFLDNSEEIKRIALKYSRDYFIEILTAYNLYEKYKKTLFNKEQPFQDLKKNYDEIYEVLKEIIEQNKKDKIVAESYDVRRFDDVYEFFRLLLSDTIVYLYKELISIVENRESQLRYKNEIKTRVEQVGDENLTKQEKNTIKRKIKDYEDNDKELSESIKKRIREKTDSFREGSFKGRSLLQILNEELRYIEPLKFEEMIEKWKQECEKNNCNYLAVEYPEFAKPGGYQLAINAKPLFIQKALELCSEGGPFNNGRAVLYIDGDMYIRKYPKIFDLDNVDFMARGWWIDPRSSWQASESITIDPYTFETSGGIMFFANNEPAKRLASLWERESSKKYQQGKADDRILSLVFNTYRLLLSMKILQLPVEYLWLTLDYHAKLMDFPGYSIKEIEEMIFVEHPECLTSEDTATDKGASNDRTPKYYAFDELVPISEIYREQLLYPDPSYTECLETYINYLKTLHYMDDGNELLYSKKLVKPGNDTDDNEQPFYVVKYKDNMGNYKYFNDTSLTYNDVFGINIKGSANKNLNDIIKSNYDITVEGNTIIIRCDPLEKRPEHDKELHQYIIKSLLNGKKIIYYPISSIGEGLYDILINKKKHLYENMDFAFKYKEKPDMYFSDYYRVEIDFNGPFMINNTNPVTLYLLASHINLSDLSESLNNGSYQFISLMRIAYITGKIQRKPIDVSARNTKSDSVFSRLFKKKTGGNTLTENSDDDFELGLEYIFANANIKNTPSHTKTNRRLFKAFYPTNRTMKTPAKTTRRISIKQATSRTATARKTMRTKTSRPRTV
jgi:hypothetical protein